MSDTPLNCLNTKPPAKTPQIPPNPKYKSPKPQQKTPKAEVLQGRLKQQLGSHLRRGLLGGFGALRLSGFCNLGFRV